MNNISVTFEYVKKFYPMIDIPNRFQIRVIRVWNLLPAETVNASTLLTLRLRLNRFDLQTTAILMYWLSNLPGPLHCLYFYRCMAFGFTYTLYAFPPHDFEINKQQITYWIRLISTFVCYESCMSMPIIIRVINYRYTNDLNYFFVYSNVKFSLFGHTVEKIISLQVTNIHFNIIR